MNKQRTLSIPLDIDRAIVASAAASKVSVTRLMIEATLFVTGQSDLASSLPPRGRPVGSGNRDIGSKGPRKRRKS